MNQRPHPSRADVMDVVTRSLRTIVAGQGRAVWLQESTSLTGTDTAVLDSLGMVMALVEVEQALQAAYGERIVVAGNDALFEDDGALATVGSFVDRICRLIESETA